MRVPKINPDEFGPGYLIRLGLVNGLKKEKDVLERILQHYPSITDHQKLKPFLLSVVLGKSTEDYCQQHTLLPIHRGLTNLEEKVTHGSMEYEYGLLRYGHFGLIRHFKVCKSCVREDIDSLGYSYYRRSHQYPGVNSCSKHGNTDLGRLYSSPLETFCNPDQIDVSQLTPLTQHDNEFINRFLSIMDGLCEFKKPTDPNGLVTIMQLRARELGFKWYSSGSKELLSDVLINRLPKEWLEDLGFNLKSKVKGVRSGSIDGALSTQKATFQSLVYIAVLSLLFNDADQVLIQIQKLNALPKQKVKDFRKFKSAYWCSEEFLELYIKLGGNAVSLSKHFQVCEQVIWKGLKIAKLPTLGLYGRKAFRALELFQNGFSLTKASNATGVPLDKLEPLLRVSYSRLITLSQTLDNSEPSSALKV